jgi:hypothetical protein
MISFAEALLHQCPGRISGGPKILGSWCPYEDQNMKVMKIPDQSKWQNISGSQNLSKPKA